MSAPDHTIWYVWAPGYETYGGKCEEIEDELLADPHLGGDEIFTYEGGTFYEPMELVEFAYRKG